MTGAARLGPGVGRYLALAYGLSYALQAAIWGLGGVDGRWFGPLAGAAMFTPALAALLTLRHTGEGWRSLPWRWPGLRWLLAALLVPMAAAVGCVALLSRLGLADSTRLSWLDGRVVTERGPFLLAHGAQSPAVFALNLVVSGCLLGVVASLLTAGEEIGWRGYLQPRLVARFGVGGGVTLLGLLWAHWHTPVILMGYNYPHTPVLGALVLFPLTTVGASFLCAAFTLPARSLWPAVVTHASFNLYFGGLVGTMELAPPTWRADLLVAALLVALGLAARWLLVPAAAGGGAPAVAPGLQATPAPRP